MNRITSSQLYSHLTCPHRLVMDAFGNPAERDAVSPFVQLLWERGTAHEQEVMAELGMPFLDLSALSGDAKEAATREAIARREPLIYSGRLSVHELLGEPDLLRFEQGGYVAVDIKSGAGREGSDTEGDAKLRQEYGVQLALYTDILTRMGLAAGRYGFIWDVHRAETRYDLDVPLGPKSPSLWELYLKTRAAMQVTLAAPAESRPALCSQCKQCVWRSACFRKLRKAGDLTLLPELGRARRDVLAAEFPTLAALGAADPAHYIHGDKTDFPGIGAKTLLKFQRRAALQLMPNAEPYLTRAVQWPQVAVELFFDIETDPMRDLCYLHGFVIRERNAAGHTSERFEGIYAADLSSQAERAAFAAALALFRRHPDALVVHYSKYERTAYRKLAGKYPDVAGPDEIEALFSVPRALDLYSDVVRPGSEWPTHDFSIKSLAKHCGFSWRDVDPSGASSIEWFDQWAKTGDPRLRQRLLDYNEDDCRAMRVVLDRLKGLPVLGSAESGDP
jgi:predicted RecB family nuclease